MSKAFSAKVGTGFAVRKCGMSKPDLCFDLAIASVLRHEGGLADDPNDPGGITNHGISLRFLQREGIDANGDGQIDELDIIGLGVKQACAIYREHFWERTGICKIGPIAIAAKVLDMAVNMGPHHGICLAQRAACACGQALKDDGILGPKTLAALETASVEPLLCAMRSEAAGYYRLLAYADPALKGFLKGWLRRAYS